MENQVVQTPEVNSISKNKNGFIEFCRFVFCWGVVSHHATFLSPNPGYIPIWGGYISVEFFFILTGYLMYASYQKQFGENRQCSAINRIYIKFKRFYPYFLISWCTVFITTHIESGKTHFSVLLWDFIHAIPQLLFLQCTGLAGIAKHYNSPTWFLSGLLMGMLIVYFLMYWGKRYFATAIAPALCLICYGHIMLIDGSLGSVHEWIGFLQAGALRAIAGLCLGSVICYIVHSVPRHHLTKFGNNIMCFCQLGLVILSLFLMSHTYGYTDIVQVMIFSLLIFISFAEETTLNRLCNSKIFFALGRFSMIIFVTQHIAYGSPSLLFYPESWPYRYGMYIVYVLLFSWLNYFIVGIARKSNIIHKLKQCLWKSVE